MFFFVDDTKSFMKPEWSVTQSSNMVHPYKWAIADVLPGKNIFRTMNLNHNEL